MNIINDRIKIAIWNLRHKIDVFFNPRHQSLRKSITPEWKDLDSRIEDFLSAVIISFVEEENGLEQIKMIEDGLASTDEELKDHWGSVNNFWDYYSSHYNIYLRLQEIYKWVKFDRKKMMAYIDSCYDNIAKYDEITKAESRLREKDTEMFNDLVKYRGYLWT